MSTNAPVLDHAPPRLSVALTLGTALWSVLALVVSGPAFTVGALGAIILGIGLFRGSRSTVALGSTGLFFGVLLAGFADASPESLVFATAAAVVAWDVATFAIGVGEEVGRAAETTRVELVHAGVSGTLALITATGGILVYRLVGGGPAFAPLALLCGAVVLVVVLRP